MYYYAALNPSTRICIGIEQLDYQLTDLGNDIIPIDSYDTSLIGKFYNDETGQFEDPSETQACTIQANDIALGTRRLDLFIGDETGLEAGSNIDNLVDAVNAAFQSASDGKTAIANAFTGVDSDITIPDNPTFARLAAEIGNISTGLQVALGSMQEYTIPSLIEGTTPFRPKIVIIYNFGAGLSNFNMGVYVSPEITENTTQQISDSANGMGNTLSRSAKPFTITDTGFSMINSGAVTNLKWIALGYE